MFKPNLSKISQNISARLSGSGSTPSAGPSDPMGAPSTCPTARRRSVHFDSCASTVLVPGSSEEGAFRGRGVGFASSKKLPADTDSSLPAKVIDEDDEDEDELAEKFRYKLAQARRQSAPAAHFSLVPVNDDETNKKPPRKLRSPPPQPLPELENEEDEEESGNSEDDEPQLEITHL